MRKTCKSQTEANDKELSLNKKTEKALETLAILCERFEQVKSNVAAIDKKFDAEYEEMRELMAKRWRLRSWRKSLCMPK